MLAALCNVRPTHLLDPEFAAAWAARPADLRPAVAPVKRAQHTDALPVITGGRRLRVID